MSIYICLFEGVWLATTPVRTTTGGAHGPVVDSEAVLRDMVTARPDFYIHTTNFESVRSMLHLNFSKCPLENKSPMHTGQHFSTPNFHVSRPTLENERPAHTVQHFCILLQPFYLMGNPLFFRTSWGTNDVTMKSQWNHNGITMKSQ